MFARISTVSRLAVAVALSLAPAMPAFATCGDGFLEEPGEQCDDGNVAAGDGCDPACQIALGDCPTGLTGLWQYDTEPDTSEHSLSIIDHLDGTLDLLFFFEGEYYPSTGTRSGTTLQILNPATWLPCDRINTGGSGFTRVSTTVCGDGQQTGGEACEDGDWESGDGCDANCTATACGNGVVTSGEQCDDGNVLAGDGCNVFCHLRECGDGELSPGQLVTCGAGPVGTCTPDVCDDGWSTPFSTTPFLDGEANAVLVDGDDYYFGGYFFTGGFASIARWNNGTWSSVGSGFGDENQVRVLAKLGSDIYAAGYLDKVRGSSTTLSAIAKWDGTSWSSVGGGVHRTGVDASIGAMLPSGSDLFVAGYFETAGSVPAVGLARWDGNAWHAVGDLLSAGNPGVGSALVRLGSDLYVGGTFDTAGGVSALNIAKWDGVAWTALGAGLPNPVQSLATDGTNIYAGGYGVVMQWDGVQWSTLWDYNVDFEPGDPFSEVRNLVVLGDNLYASGQKIMDAWGMARWDGTQWTPLGSGIRKDENDFLGPDIRIDDVAVDGARLIVVGDYFEKAGGRPASDVVVWTESECGEKCDDGNVSSGDGCDSNCSATACCNGIVSAGETCDDANEASGDGCDSNCKVTACGNGIATAGETCDDGNAVAGDGCETDCRLTSVSENAVPGGTVSSPPATESFPVQAAVTTPGGGAVGISEATTPLAPSGFAVLGTVLEITAPPASVMSPLAIKIAVHLSAIPPGYEPEDLSVSRDGVAIGDCTGTPGQATPDPCIDDRVVAGDSVEISVLTSHASTWAALGRGMGEAEQGCVLAATKAATGVTTSYLKSATKCLKLAQSDKGDIGDCLAVAAVTKSSKAMQKTVKSLAACPLGVPFGFPDTGDANMAGMAGGQQLVADVLGEDIAAIIESVPEGAACRSAAVGGISKVVARKAEAFLACEAAGFSAAGTPFLSSREIAGCLGAVQEDAEEAVAKSVGALSKKLATKCIPMTLLSGDCGSAANPVACLETHIDCRFCSTMRTIAGFEQGCDLYDDGLPNGSCR